MGYRTQSSDTSEVVDRLQFDHLRRMGRKERFESALARTDEGLFLMWRSLKRRMPTATPAELHVEWVRVQFGDELSRKIEAFLQCKTRENIEIPFAEL